MILERTYLRLTTPEGGSFFVKAASIQGLRSTADSERGNTILSVGGDLMYCENSVNAILDALLADVVDVQNWEQAA
jgi:hypothetical protein